MTSHESVRSALFDVLKLPIPSSRTTKTGRVKLDADVSFPPRKTQLSRNERSLGPCRGRAGHLQALAEMQHPIAARIIEYRQIEKLLQSLDSYCSLREARRVASPRNSVSRCRTTWKVWMGEGGAFHGRACCEQMVLTAECAVAGTAAGHRHLDANKLRDGPRLCGEPQPAVRPQAAQLRRAHHAAGRLALVRGQHTVLLCGRSDCPRGAHSASSTPRGCRSAFVAQPGWLLVSGDYRQQELRIMAHVSGDERLCSILRSGGDPFQQIAADWHGTSPSQVGAPSGPRPRREERNCVVAAELCDGPQVTQETRNRVKQLVYALNYGMGPNTLAQKTHCSVETAKGHLEGLKARYPELVSTRRSRWVGPSGTTRGRR